MKFGQILFAALLLCCAIGNPFKLFAQAGAGYSKINPAPVSGLNFVDSPITDGNVYQYQITAVNAAGESTPLTSTPVTIPATGTHSVSLSWGASPTAGVIYNVYRIQIIVPNPPAAPLNATVN